MADCHIGSWRNPKLRSACSSAFQLAVEKCIQRKVDFVLISGDLFNTAVPAIDSLRLVVEELRKLKDYNIPVYIIAGSHDFSPSGKTMLDVLEHARLVVNVARGTELPDGRLKLSFTADQKTGVKITGMIGRKGGLESGYYHLLANEHLEQESGEKIFLFHTALAELKPKGFEKIDAMPVSLLPKGFDYYAGGHVHVVERHSFDGRNNIVFPGPTFPNNFAELEKLKHGFFVIFENGAIEHVPLPVCPSVSISVDASGKSPSEVEVLVRSEIDKHNLRNAIVTLRCFGCLGKGRPSDIDWNDLFHDFYAKGSYVVLKNTLSLTSRDVEVVMLDSDVDQLEDSLIREHLSQVKLGNDDFSLVKSLMSVLSAEKLDGERVSDFEFRVNSELDSLFEQ